MQKLHSLKFAAPSGNINDKLREKSQFMKNARESPTSFVAIYFKNATAGGKVSQFKIKQRIISHTLPLGEI